MVSTTSDAPNDDQWGQTQLESGSVSSIDDDQAPKSPSSRKQQNLECPRCSSMNTKFCYYNNYNKAQPRHFCKACKRHWTKGGTLRNVPVGGGRKNKRLRTSAPAPAPTPTKNQTEILNFPMTHIKSHPPHHQNHQIHHQQQQYPSSSWMLPLHQEQCALPFSFSNLSHFDSITPSSIPGLNLDEHFDSSSTITAITPTDSAVFSHPWQGPNDWNWNEVDPFISADLNISWDDIEIKP